MNNDLRIFDKESLPTDGFAGITEKRILMSPNVWTKSQENHAVSNGFGDLLYISYGHFNPLDGAPLHGHEDVDIVSVILSGEVGHKGTLGHGSSILSPGAQVQRAGTGMKHSEFNLNRDPAEFVQIWFAPPSIGLSPDYRNFKLKEGELTNLLGDSASSFESTMKCEAGFLSEGSTLHISQQFVAVVIRGKGTFNGECVTEGQLVEGSSAKLKAYENFGFILITQSCS